MAEGDRPVAGEFPLTWNLADKQVEKETATLPAEEAVEEKLWKHWPPILWWWASLVTLAILPVPAVVLLQFLPPPIAAERLPNDVLITYITVSLGSGGLLGFAGERILRPFAALGRKE